MQAIRKNVDNMGWAGVIEFVAALHSDPTPLLEYLAKKSEMGSVKNFPSMARRTQTLILLYRCLAAGVNIEKRVREELYRGIVEAHGHMAETFRNGGVFPVAVLVKDGVRHSYLYYNRRPTLASALQPLRRLANEILLAPSDVYADIALRWLHEVALHDGPSHEEFERVAATLCLAVPITSSRPREVKRILANLKTGDDFLTRLVDESLEVLERDWL